MGKKFVSCPETSTPALRITQRSLQWVMAFFSHLGVERRAYEFNLFKAGIKSLRATLHDEIFYWGFCFLNRAFL
jgi:hypothetical protein